MPKLVEIPDVGVVEFPDDMADEDISSSIETDILPNYAKQESLAAPDATDPSVENSSSMRPSYASALADTLQKNKLFGSATSALGQAADKTIKRKPDGDWDLPLLKQDSDNAFVQAAGGLATLGGQKLGARLDSAGAATDQKAIQKVFHDFQQANNLSDEEVTSTWQDLGNLSRGWDEGEKLRVLSNGSIIPNPTDSDWLDSTKATELIRNAQAPEAAKSSLLRNLPQIQTNLAADKLGEYEAGGELSNMATGAVRTVTPNSLIDRTITPSEWAKQQGREDLGSPKFVQDYEAYLQTTPEWKRNVSGLAGRTALGWSKVANTALGIAGLLGSDSAGQLAAEGTEAANMARSGMEPTGLAGTIAEEVPSVVAQIFGTRLLGAGASALAPSMAGSATTLGTYGLAGLQSAGLAYADELAQGTPEEEAREKAVRSGISTTLVTAAFGQGSLGGVERVAAGNMARGITVRELLTTAKDHGIKNLLLSPGLREFGRGVLKASAGEATEEGVDQLLQSFLTADPDTNLANAWDGALQAGMVGGIISGAADVTQRSTQEDRAALNLAMEALPDAPKAAAAAMDPIEKSTEKQVETGILDNFLLSSEQSGLGAGAATTEQSAIESPTAPTEEAPLPDEESPLPQQPPLETPSGDLEVPVEEAVAPESPQAAEAPLEPSPVPTGIEPTESLPEGTTPLAATGGVGVPEFAETPLEQPQAPNGQDTQRQPGPQGPAETPQAEAALQGGPTAVEEGTAGEVDGPDAFDLNAWVEDTHPQEASASRYLSPGAQYKFHLSVWEHAGRPEVGNEPAPEQEAAKTEEVRATLEAPTPLIGTTSTPEYDGQPDGERVSVQHRFIDEARARRGLPPVDARPVLPEAEVWDQALETERQYRESGQPGTAGARLFTELVESPPKALNPSEKALLLHELVRSEGAVDAAQDQLNALPENAPEGTRKEAQAQMEKAQADYNLLTTYLRNAGSESGLSLQAQKKIVNRDYTLARVVGDLQAAANANSDKPVEWTRKDQADAVEWYEKYRAAKQKVEQLESENTEQQTLVEQLTRDVERAQARLANQLQTTRAKKAVQAKLDPLIEAARARIAARSAAQAEALNDTTKLHASIVSPEFLADLKDYAIIYSAKFANAAMSLADFSAQVIADLGEKITPYLESLFRDARSVYIETAESVTGGDAPSPTTVLEGIDPELPLDRKTVGALARAHVVAGLRGSEVLETTFNDLVQKFPDLTREQVSELFTGYGQQAYPRTRSEAAKELSRLRTLERLALKLKDVQEGRLPKASGSRKSEPDAEVQKLQTQYREALRESGLNVPSEDVREARTLGYITKRKAELTRQMQAGDFADKKPLAPVNTAKVRQARYELQNLLDEHHEARGKAILKSRNLANKISYYVKNSATIQKQLRLGGDIGVLNRNMAAATRIVIANDLKKLLPGKIGRDARAQQSQFAQVLKAGIRAARSPEYDLENYEKILQRPNASWDQVAGMHYVSPSESPNRSNEDLPPLKLMEKAPFWVWPALAATKAGIKGLAMATNPVFVPIFGPSFVRDTIASVALSVGQKPAMLALDRIQRSMTNQARAILFDQMIDNLPSVSVEDARAVAHAVLVATGRGGAKKGTKGFYQGVESMMPAMTKAFLASRYYVANIQALTAAPLVGKMSKEARMQIAGNYAKSVQIRAATTLLLALAFGSTALIWEDRDDEEPGVILDPDSKDFQRVRVNKDLTLDMLGGSAQWGSMFWRTYTGRVRDHRASSIEKGTYGQVHKMTPEEQRKNLLSFTSSKFNMLPRWGVETGIIGEYYGGKPAMLATALDEATSIVMAKDIQDIAKYAPDKTTALATMGLLFTGANVSVGDWAEDKAEWQGLRDYVEGKRIEREAEINE
jgi:hypothetical protein